MCKITAKKIYILLKYLTFKKINISNFSLLHDCKMIIDWNIISRNNGNLLCVVINNSRISRILDHDVWLLLFDELFYFFR